MWIPIFAAAIPSHGGFALHPPPLLFRTIRASWSDNDCLVIGDGQGMGILPDLRPKSPSKMATKRL
jgi:hypothetical protein